jgi:hypothetical protein
MGNLVPRAFVLVTWELGLAYFWTRIMRFGLLGLGMTDTKMGMGNPYTNIKTVV